MNMSNFEKIMWLVVILMAVGLLVMSFVLVGEVMAQVPEPFLLERNQPIIGFPYELIYHLSYLGGFDEDELTYSESDNQIIIRYSNYELIGHAVDHLPDGSINYSLNYSDIWLWLSYERRGPTKEAFSWIVETPTGQVYLGDYEEPQVWVYSNPVENYSWIGPSDNLQEINVLPHVRIFISGVKTTIEVYGWKITF